MSYDQLTELDDMMSSSDSYLAAQAARSPLMDVRTALDLASSEARPDVLKALAERPGLTTKALRALLSAEPPAEVAAMAIRGYRGHKALREAARSTNRFIRREVAAHKKTEEYVLRELSYDNFVDTRVAIATRKEIPVGIQRILARDPAAEVRRALASHGELFSSARETLEEDPDPRVRQLLE